MGPKVTAVSGYVRSRVNPRGLGRYRELKRRWRAKRDLYFAVVVGIRHLCLMRRLSVLSGLQPVPHPAIGAQCLMDA